MARRTTIGPAFFALTMVEQNALVQRELTTPVNRIIAPSAVGNAMTTPANRKRGVDHRVDALRYATTWTPTLRRYAESLGYVFPTDEPAPRSPLPTCGLLGLLTSPDSEVILAGEWRHDSRRRLHQWLGRNLEPDMDWREGVLEPEDWSA